MDALVNAFNAMYSSLTGARARVRIGGRYVIEQVLSSGMDFTHADSDEGLYEHPNMVVSTLDLNETDSVQLLLGSVVEVSTVPDDSDWRKVRILRRRDLGGVLELTLQAITE